MAKQVKRTYSRKQAGVIYRAVKEGKLEMDADRIGLLYDRADLDDFFGYEVADRINEWAEAVREAVDAVFAGDYAKAQTALNGVM